MWIHKYIITLVEEGDGRKVGRGGLNYCELQAEEEDQEEQEEQVKSGKGEV